MEIGTIDAPCAFKLASSSGWRAFLRANLPALLIFGSIYPLVSLRLLSRRDVVAACQKKTISPNTF